MNDFLHSLRSGNYQRYRKPYSGNNRTNGNDYGNQKKTDYDLKNAIIEQAATFLKEVAPLINDFLNGDTVERRVIAEERKAEAMETIADALSKLAGMEKKETEHASKKVSRITQQNDEDEFETESDIDSFSVKDKAVNTIKKMRGDGMSYEQIARHLEEEKIPTLSGRGKWHAPTVSNLLKNVA